MNVLWCSCSCTHMSALGTCFSLFSPLDPAHMCTGVHAAAIAQQLQPAAVMPACPGRQVHATLLHTGGDSSRSVGDALCRFVAKIQPAALVLMKENKSAVVQFFLGSVSRFCAAHSTAPVIIVPA